MSLYKRLLCLREEELPPISFHVIVIAGKGGITVKIWIDGDGCPVVEKTVRTAAKYGISCAVVCDNAHDMSQKGYGEVITVDKGSDSADFALVNRIAAGDLAITQDYGLGALCLARRARVLTQNGMEITRDNIDGLLLQRHEARRARAAGRRMKGPSKRTREQDEAFEKALIRMIGEEQSRGTH